LGAQALGQQGYIAAIAVDRPPSTVRGPRPGSTDRHRPDTL